MAGAPFKQIRCGLVKKSATLVVSQFRTYLKIEKRQSDGPHLCKRQDIDCDISKDSAICSWLKPLRANGSLTDERF